ncbi:alpha/beta hydrolase-fold protein [Roseiconus nitratireducens]|uniref:alpha/beta hydrolase-fold protein n=1 Tax=Roseiconus nitratireducens TaxID=2605748 RepID=UPI001375A904|nr:alpha/beta hydrolase-fold protein [Roseiconus nitratireducens]
MISTAYSQRIQSPEVHPDGRVTLRVVAPEADEVVAEISRVEDGRFSLTKGDEGIWEGVHGPLKPGIYEYSFEVDQTPQIDRLNRWIKKWYSLNSLFEVPGDPPLLTEVQSVPHGVLHHHLYSSPVTDSQRRCIVYTPPSYQSDPDRTFPVLFLLHGFGDDQTAWTEVGRAHLIADNLIAAGKAKEMLIVMPHGHPVDLPYGDRDENYGAENNAAMQREIVEVLLPWVAEHYRVASTPEQRAIAGLSMGGGHAIRISLGSNAFGWVGAFSAAAPEEESLQELCPDLEQFKQQTRLFWIPCGKDDFLLERNEAFDKQLSDAGVTHQFVKTAGAHNWDVWRDDYLPKYLPQLFESPDSATAKRN